MDRIIKAAALVLLGLVNSVQAEEFKETVWYCVEEETAGLIYEDGDWQTSSLKIRKHVIKQTSETDLTFPASLRMNPLQCQRDHLEFLITCTDALTSFVLNTQSGLATHSDISGWLFHKDPKPPYADVMTVSALKCETF